MSGKTGVFICPSCEAVVRSDQSLDDGIVCPECDHQFGKKTGKAKVASATKVAIMPGGTRPRSESVIRNLTAKKAPTVKPVGVIESPEIKANLSKAPDVEVNIKGDEEVVMPDGTRRVRRRKKRPKKERNKGLILFLAGWLSVIVIVFALFKLGGKAEVVEDDKEGSTVDQAARDTEVLRRFLEPVSTSFKDFLGHPTEEGREQFIDRAPDLSLDFERHYRLHAFPKSETSFAMVGANVLSFSAKNIGIETLWRDEDDNRLGAVHLWDGKGWKLDWENFAPHSSESWVRFRSELGSESGVFRLLVRKRRTANEREKFYLSFYRAREFGEEKDEYKKSESPEVSVKTESNLGKEFLKLWKDHEAEIRPYGTRLPDYLDPANCMRITVELAWEKDDLGKSIMVLKDIIGVSWFGGRIQEFHLENLNKAREKAEAAITTDPES